MCEVQLTTDDLGPWRRAARRELKRTQRLIGRLKADAEKARTGPTLRSWGEALKIQLHKVPTGQDQVRLAAPWLPEGEVIVSLRRELGPKANMTRLFSRARGYDAALPEIERRLAESELRASELTALIARIDGLCEHTTDDPADLTTLIADLQRARVKLAAVDPRAASNTDRRGLAKGAQRLPPSIHRFTTSRGTEVLAGRNAVANDTLVTRLARGRDVWLHTRDRPGSHVLLRLQRKDETPHQTDLLECVVLAAHLSGISKGDRADVSWTFAKHVRKPKRAAAGLVLVSAEKALLVDVDAETVDGFYARRDRSA